MLDDLDKELTRRGHRFCRFAGDCNICVRSHRAGERVMASITRFLTDKPQLKVNEAKSTVARPEGRKFLGFSISNATGANDALRRNRSLSSKTKCGTLRSAILLACSQTWKPGFAGDCECISGDNGRAGTSDSWSFAASASRSSPHRLPPVRRRGSGECPGAGGPARPAQPLL
ncbi:hypothetical protein [Bradyrhizobium cytisi]|uniref:hypothetical protein n=1 Tax=Bradyrhizobium cytisi TaxID=515489 RepID=UPI001FECD8D6|nr:hypothetical protein [Bradyrhizobium cytisi]